MSERDGFEPGVPCWVDLWEPDAEAAVRFYSELFGWEAEETTPPGSPHRYFMCRLRGRDVAAIGSPPGPGAPPVWGTHVWVESADRTAEAVTAAGGRVLMEPFDSLDGGRLAVVADPAGAVFHAWQPGAHRGAQLVNEPSAWSISALSTPDPDGAKAFYGAVLGWETEPFGDATLWRLPGFVGGEPQQPVARDVVAVMMPAGANGPPPSWNVDFWIADPDAAAETTSRLGGTVIMPPTDGPVGRSAVLADPAGAAFSVSKVVPD